MPVLQVACMFRQVVGAALLTISVALLLTHFGWLRGAGSSDFTAPPRYPPPPTNEISCLLPADGGTKLAFLFGTSTSPYPADYETPAVPLELEPFCLLQKEVSVGEFSAFVEETGYVSTAEQVGSSFVFVSAEERDHPALCDGQVAARTPWWRLCADVTWFRSTPLLAPPPGVEPVVHVSALDAQEYCRWRGGRLPTEVEWEYAARGGLEQMLFPWGNDEEQTGSRANIWTGSFPYDNTKADGYVKAAPVDAYGPQNRFQLYNMAGNVWEWTQSRWIVHGAGQRRNISSGGGGSSGGGSTDELYRKVGEEEVLVQRGGSFLCHKSYCFRYRVSARTKSVATDTAEHVGFRCVFPPPLAS